MAENFRQTTARIASNPATNDVLGGIGSAENASVPGRSDTSGQSELSRLFPTIASHGNRRRQWQDESHIRDSSRSFQRASSHPYPSRNRRESVRRQSKQQQTFIKDVYLLLAEDTSVPRNKSTMYRDKRVVNSVTFSKDASEWTIVDLIHHIFSDHFDQYSSENQFNFVKVVNACIDSPNVGPEFRWDGHSLKHFYGQGGVYIQQKGYEASL
ncbi:uncharacterized protein [Oscarella lobularis]|uniref:uncharacterized protein n=1 Tax=Oscarella lobularis TaxID=121494 RepID=UPI0033135C83